MRRVSGLLGAFDVSEGQAVESRQARDLSIHHRGGDEDGPSDKPNREEHECHQTKEANEEVSI